MGVLLIGTKKGLFIQRDGATTGPLLTGWEVHHAVNVGDTLVAATNSAFFGGSVQRSVDGGETWERSDPLRRGQLVSDPVGELRRLWRGRVRSPADELANPGVGPRYCIAPSSARKALDD